MRKFFFALAPLCILLSMTSCEKKEPVLENNAIHRDDEFGGAFIDISIADFNKKGFAFGDSLDLSFSNGVTYNDIGYYSGYYVPAGQELVVGYAGYDYIKFCINYGEDVYAMNAFDENTTVTITRAEKGKYLTIEETLSISYSDDINEYESPEQFANFREVTAGNIKPGVLYRGASPIDNKRKRASTVDGLIQAKGIVYDLDLADTREVIDSCYAKTDFASPYFKSLDENNKVLPIGMGAAYKLEDFSGKLKNMLLTMIEEPGSYYIHCLEGKDRTGYVCMVLEALCGATYEELIEDYFITYHNYYGIEKGTDKYEAIKSIHIDEMIRYVFSFEQSTNLLTANYKSHVDDYLLSIGLTNAQINAVADRLTN